MASENTSLSLLSERARSIFTFIDSHRHLPAGGSRCPSRSHFPEVRISVQHFIDMGLRPATAQHLLEYFSKFVARYRQNVEYHIGRVVEGGYLSPTFYHDMFVLLYRRTIQSWESQIVAAIQVWLYQTGADLRRQWIDVSLVTGRFPASLDAHLTDSSGRHYEECYSF